MLQGSRGEGSPCPDQRTAVSPSVLFRTDIPSEDQLIAHGRTVQEICDMIGRIPFLLKTGAADGNGAGLPICTACFTGKYPIQPPKEDIRGEYVQ